MRFPQIRSMEELEALIQEVGFLPFFENSIPGYSIEECTPKELWFAPDKDGPWEWKGPIALKAKCAYGKFFQGKTGFISREHFPAFLNYRRDGYDFDARWDDGLAPMKDKQIMDVFTEYDSMMTHELKSICNYGKNGQKGFETVITRLQMQTYLTVQNFEYRTDKNGKPYGWGIARYAMPEVLFGTEMIEKAYREEPKISAKKIAAYLETLLPDASAVQIAKLIG